MGVPAEATLEAIAEGDAFVAMTDGPASGFFSGESGLSVRGRSSPRVQATASNQGTMESHQREATPRKRPRATHDSEPAGAPFTATRCALFRPRHASTPTLRRPSARRRTRSSRRRRRGPPRRCPRGRRRTPVGRARTRAGDRLRHRSQRRRIRRARPGQVVAGERFVTGRDPAQQPAARVRSRCQAARAVTRCVLRNSAGGSPAMRLNARLNTLSDR